jgi:predicted type IV restriction endonuclease
VLWQMNQGHTVDIRGRHYQGGTVRGFADLFGMRMGGRFFALECKTGNARQTREQVLFGKLVVRMGGHYAVVRSVADAWAALERARAGGMKRAA